MRSRLQIQECNRNRKKQGKTEQQQQRGPLDGSVAVAADGEHLSVVPLDGLAEDVPGVALDDLVHGGVGQLRLRAELLGLADDAHGAALEVRFHDRQHVRGD
jgi:hypothetical protein